MTELSDAEKALARHILAHCREHADPITSTVPDEVEIDHDAWTIEAVDKCAEGSIEVHAKQGGYETTLERRARYSPPSKAHEAEYEQHEGTVRAIARADWSDDPLAGDCNLTLEWTGGAPSPPDPEPHDV